MACSRAALLAPSWLYLFWMYVSCFIGFLPSLASATAEVSSLNVPGYTDLGDSKASPSEDLGGGQPHFPSGYSPPGWTYSPGPDNILTPLRVPSAPSYDYKAAVTRAVRPDPAVFDIDYNTIETPTPPTAPIRPRSAAQADSHWTTITTSYGSLPTVPFGIGFDNIGTPLAPTPALQLTGTLLNKTAAASSTSYWTTMTTSFAALQKVTLGVGVDSKGTPLIQGASAGSYRTTITTSVPAIPTAILGVDQDNNVHVLSQLASLPRPNRPSNNTGAPSVQPRDTAAATIAARQADVPPLPPFFTPGFLLTQTTSIPNGPTVARTLLLGTNYQWTPHSAGAALPTSPPPRPSHAQVHTRSTKLRFSSPSSPSFPMIKSAATTPVVLLLTPAMDDALTLARARVNSTSSISTPSTPFTPVPPTPLGPSSLSSLLSSLSSLTSVAALTLNATGTTSVSILPTVSSTTRFYIVDGKPTPLAANATLNTATTTSKMSKTTKTTKTAKTTKTTKTPNIMKTTKTAKTTKPPKMTKTTKTPLVTKTTKAPKTTTTKTPQMTKTTKSPKMTKTTMTPKTTKTEKTKTNTKTKSMKTVTVVKSKETGKA